MRINPVEMYSQKMFEINERINERLSLIEKSQNFHLALQTAQSKTGGAVSKTSSVTGTGSSYSSLILGNSAVKGTVSDGSYINLDSYDGSMASGFTSKYDDIISEKSALYGVNENLIKAMIKAESDFNPNVVSSAGAMGLMQLMPVNVKELSVQDPFDPAQNIDGGIREIKGYLKSYNGDVKLALAAYNCGPTRVRKLGLDNLNDPEQFAKLPKETRDYITKIMKYLQ